MFILIFSMQIATLNLHLFIQIFNLFKRSKFELSIENILLTKLTDF